MFGKKIVIKTLTLNNEPLLDFRRKISVLIVKIALRQIIAFIAIFYSIYVLICTLATAKKNSVFLANQNSHIITFHTYKLQSTCKLNDSTTYKSVLQLVKKHEFATVFTLVTVFVHVCIVCTCVMHYYRLISYFHS